MCNCGRTTDEYPTRGCFGNITHPLASGSGRSDGVEA